ncbi:MAG: hypothetical protein KY455_08265 [Euryarchaeota archaeon]|nr:hypothetical protein [Euryarchaeota archaeon]
MPTHRTERVDMSREDRALAEARDELLAVERRLREAKGGKDLDEVKYDVHQALQAIEQEEETKKASGRPRATRVDRPRGDPALEAAHDELLAIEYRLSQVDGDPRIETVRRDVHHALERLDKKRNGHPTGATRFAYNARRLVQAVGAIKETQRRAQDAPERFAGLARFATRRTTEGYKRYGAGLAALGLLAFGAFIMVSVGLVRVATLFVGPLWSPFLVAAVYAAIGLSFYAYGKSAKERGEEARHTAYEEAKDEVREITEPIRVVTRQNGETHRHGHDTAPRGLPSLHARR